jgi:ATP-binding protein involved in chromosome partitioning
VTTPDPTAVGDTARSERLFREEGVPLLGVVPNMTAATCPDCGTDHAVFPTTDVGAAFDAPVLDSFPVDPALADAATAGERAADLATAVDDALATDPAPPGALDLRGVPARAAREQLRAERRALAPGESLRVVVGRPDAVEDALPDATTAVDRLGPERWLVEVAAEDAVDGRTEVSTGGAE